MRTLSIFVASVFALSLLGPSGLCDVAFAAIGPQSNELESNVFSDGNGSAAQDLVSEEDTSDKRDGEIGTLEGSLSDDAEKSASEVNPLEKGVEVTDASEAVFLSGSGVPDDTVYDHAELVTALQDPSQAVIHIGADFTLDDVLVINRDVVFEAVFDEDEANTERTIASAAAKRHFTLSGNRTVEFKNIALDGKGTSGGIDVANDATISGVTIQNCSVSQTAGASTSSGAYAGTGGALHLARYRSLALSHVTLRNNQATGTGGAINAAADTTVTISDSVISGNSSGGNGGGVHLGAGASGEKLAEIANTEIFGNTSGSAGGGAFFASSEAKPRNVTIANTSISDNAATAYGGGLALSTSAIAMLDGVAITYNETGDSGSSASGGGIHSNTNADVTVKGGSLIKGNRALRHGGGIYGAANSTITVTEGSSVDRNTTSGNGGGIYAAFATSTASAANLKVDGGSSITNNKTDGAYAPVSANGWGGGICAESLDLDGATVSGNTAKLWGGGVYLPDTATDASIANAAISSNTAAGGAGVYGGGALALSGSTVTNNVAARPDGKESYGGGISSSGVVTVADSKITSNKAYFGAGANISGSGTLTVENTFVNLNEASYGGGIYGGVDAWVKVYGSTIHENSGILNASQGGAGGIRARKLILMDSVVSQNTSSMYGGGLDTQEQVTDWVIGGKTQIVNNRTTSTNVFYPGQGGAISDRGAPGSKIVIEGTAETPIVIFGNTSSRTGGGIHLNSATELDMRYVSIEGNSAGTTGGGIHASANLALADTVSIAGNSAGTNGGGVYANGSAVTVDGTEFGGNTAAMFGGGIFAARALALQNAAITGNSAFAGGGIFVGSDSAALSVTGSTLTGNHAETTGGAISLPADNRSVAGFDYYPSYESLTMSGCTMNGNSAGWSLMTRVLQRDIETHEERIAGSAGGFSGNTAYAYNTYDVGSHFVGQAHIAFDGNGATTEPEISGHLQYIGWNHSGFSLLDPEGRLSLPTKQRKTGYIFKGWNTKPDGSGDTVADGNELLKLANVSSVSDDGFKDPSLEQSLYAIWEECGHGGSTAKPDCEQGAVCTDCGEALPKLGHDWGNWSITEAPMLDAQGTAKRVCKRDGDHKDAASVPVLSDESVWEVENRTEPTCEEKGSQAYASQYGTVAVVLPAKGHSWGEWKITREPTPDEDGEKQRECSVCAGKESCPVNSTGGAVSRDPNGSNTSSSESKGPNHSGLLDTGDKGGILVPMAFAVLSLSGIIVALIQRRKRRA